MSVSGFVDRLLDHVLPAQLCSLFSPPLDGSAIRSSLSGRGREHGQGSGMELQNLTLNAQQCNQLLFPFMPVALKSGRIDDVSVRVEWSRLTTQPLHVRLSGVNLTMKPPDRGKKKKREERMQPALASSTETSGIEEKEPSTLQVPEEEATGERKVTETMSTGVSTSSSSGSGDSGSEDDHDWDPTALLERAIAQKLSALEQSGVGGAIGPSMVEKEKAVESEEASKGGLLSRWRTGFISAATKKAVSIMLNALHIDVRDIKIEYEQEGDEDEREGMEMKQEEEERKGAELESKTEEKAASTSGSKIVACFKLDSLSLEKSKLSAKDLGMSHLNSLKQMDAKGVELSVGRVGGETAASSTQTIKPMGMRPILQPLSAQVTFAFNSSIDARLELQTRLLCPQVDLQCDTAQLSALSQVGARMVAHQQRLQEELERVAATNFRCATEDERRAYIDAYQRGVQQKRLNKEEKDRKNQLERELALADLILLRAAAHEELVQESKGRQFMAARSPSPTPPTLPSPSSATAVTPPETSFWHSFWHLFGLIEEEEEVAPETETEAGMGLRSEEQPREMEMERETATVSPAERQRIYEEIESKSEAQVPLSPSAAPTQAPTTLAPEQLTPFALDVQFEAVVDEMHLLLADDALNPLLRFDAISPALFVDLRPDGSIITMAGVRQMTVTDVAEPENEDRPVLDEFRELLNIQPQDDKWMEADLHPFRLCDRSFYRTMPMLVQFCHMDDTPNKRPDWVKEEEASTKLLDQAAKTKKHARINVMEFRLQRMQAQLHVGTKLMKLPALLQQCTQPLSGPTLSQPTAPPVSPRCKHATPTVGRAPAILSLTPILPLCFHVQLLHPSISLVQHPHRLDSTRLTANGNVLIQGALTVDQPTAVFYTSAFSSLERWSLHCSDGTDESTVLEPVNLSLHGDSSPSSLVPKCASRRMTLVVTPVHIRINPLSTVYALPSSLLDRIFYPSLSEAAHAADASTTATKQPSLAPSAALSETESKQQLEVRTESWLSNWMRESMDSTVSVLMEDIECELEEQSGELSVPLARGRLSSIVLEARMLQQQRRMRLSLEEASANVYARRMQESEPLLLPFSCHLTIDTNSSLLMPSLLAPSTVPIHRLLPQHFIDGELGMNDAIEVQLSERGLSQLAHSFSDLSTMHDVRIKEIRDGQAAPTSLSLTRAYPYAVRNYTQYPISLVAMEMAAQRREDITKPAATEAILGRGEERRVDEATIDVAPLMAQSFSTPHRKRGRATGLLTVLVAFAGLRVHGTHGDGHGALVVPMRVGLHWVRCELERDPSMMVDIVCEVNVDEVGTRTLTLRSAIGVRNDCESSLDIQVASQSGMVEGLAMRHMMVRKGEIYFLPCRPYSKFQPDAYREWTKVKVRPISESEQAAVEKYCTEKAQKKSAPSTLPPATPLLLELGLPPISATHGYAHAAPNASQLARLQPHVVALVDPSVHICVPTELEVEEREETGWHSKRHPFCLLSKLVPDAFDVIATSSSRSWLYALCAPLSIDNHFPCELAISVHQDGQKEERLLQPGQRVQLHSVSFVHLAALTVRLPALASEWSNAVDVGEERTTPAKIAIKSSGREPIFVNTRVQINGQHEVTVYPDILLYDLTGCGIQCSQDLLNVSQHFDELLDLQPAIAYTLPPISAMSARVNRIYLRPAYLRQWSEPISLQYAHTLDVNLTVRVRQEGVAGGGARLMMLPIIVDVRDGTGKRKFTKDIFVKPKFQLINHAQMPLQVLTMCDRKMEQEQSLVEPTAEMHAHPLYFAQDGSTTGERHIRVRPLMGAMASWAFSTPIDLQAGGVHSITLHHLQHHGVCIFLRLSVHEEQSGLCFIRLESILPPPATSLTYSHDVTTWLPFRVENRCCRLQLRWRQIQSEKNERSWLSCDPFSAFSFALDSPYEPPRFEVKLVEFVTKRPLDLLPDINMDTMESEKEGKVTGRGWQLQFRRDGPTRVLMLTDGSLSARAVEMAAPEKEFMQPAELPDKSAIEMELTQLRSMVGALEDDISNLEVRQSYQMTKLTTIADGRMMRPPHLAPDGVYLHLTIESLHTAGEDPMFVRAYIGRKECEPVLQTRNLSGAHRTLHGDPSASNYIDITTFTPSDPLRIEVCETSMLVMTRTVASVTLQLQELGSEKVSMMRMPLVSPRGSKVGTIEFKGTVHLESPQWIESRIKHLQEKIAAEDRKLRRVQKAISALESVLRVVSDSSIAALPADVSRTLLPQFLLVNLTLSPLGLVDVLHRLSLPLDRALLHVSCGEWMSELPLFSADVVLQQAIQVLLPEERVKEEHQDIRVDVVVCESPDEVESREQKGEWEEKVTKPRQLERHEATTITTQSGVEEERKRGEETQPVATAVLGLCGEEGEKEERSPLPADVLPLTQPSQPSTLEPPSPTSPSTLASPATTRLLCSISFPVSRVAQIGQSELLLPMKDISAGDAVVLHVAIDTEPVRDATKLAYLSFGISARIPHISLSLSSARQDLAQIRLVQSQLELIADQCHARLCASVGQVQGDNMMRDAVHEVILGAPPSDQPHFEASMRKSLARPLSSIDFDRINIDVAPLHVNLEEDLGIALYEVMNKVTGAGSVPPPDEPIFECRSASELQPLLAPSPPIYIERLRLSPLRFILSIEPTRQQKSDWMMRLLGALTSIHQARIGVSAHEFNNLQGDASVVLGSIGRAYIGELVTQVARILGSLDLIGAPAITLSRLGRVMTGRPTSEEEEEKEAAQPRKRRSASLRGPMRPGLTAISGDALRAATMFTESPVSRDAAAMREIQLERDKESQQYETPKPTVESVKEEESEHPAIGYEERKSQPRQEMKEQSQTKLQGQEEKSTQSMQGSLSSL